MTASPVDLMLARLNAIAGEVAKVGPDNEETRKAVEASIAKMEEAVSAGLAKQGEAFDGMRAHHAETLKAAKAAPVWAVGKAAACNCDALRPGRSRPSGARPGACGHRPDGRVLRHPPGGAGERRPRLLGNAARRRGGCGAAGGMRGVVLCGDDVRSVFARPRPANLLDRAPASSGTGPAGRRIDAGFACFRPASPAPSGEPQDHGWMDYRPCGRRSGQACGNGSLSRSLPMDAA